MTDSLLSELFHTLNLVAIERQPDHTFFLRTPSPTWLSGAFAAAPAGERNTLSGAFPFLDDFLRQASGAWQAGAHASLVSGPFAATVNEDELLLRASALTIDGRAILVLERLVGAADTRPILQKARQHMLDLEALARQASNANAPAAAIASAATALQATPLSPDQRAIVDRLVTEVAALRSALDGISGPAAAPTGR